MKRGSVFLIGFAAAGLTFGTLFATLGAERFAGCSKHWSHHCGVGHQGCGGDHHQSCHSNNNAAQPGEH